MRSSKRKEYFRDREAEAIRRLSSEEGVVIDCGGGAVLDPENIRNLKEKGTVFCLTASPEVILRRTQGRHHRPLLNTEDPLSKIRSLLAERRSAYEAAADFMIDTDQQTVRETADEIIRLLNND